MITKFDKYTDPLEYFLKKENECPYYKNIGKDIHNYISISELPKDFYEEIRILLYLYEEKNESTYSWRTYNVRFDSQIKTKVKIYVKDRIIKKILNNPGLLEKVQETTNKFSSDGRHIDKGYINNFYSKSQSWILLLFLRALKSKKLLPIIQANKYNL